MILSYDILNFVLRKISGCRIPVVHMFWEHVDWVRFPAARQGRDEQANYFACIWEAKDFSMRTK